MIRNPPDYVAANGRNGKEVDQLEWQIQRFLENPTRQMVKLEINVLASEEWAVVEVAQKYREIGWRVEVTESLMTLTPT